MFRSKKNREPSEIDEAIKEVHKKMRDVGPGSEEYDKCLKHLKKLNAIRDGEARFRRPSTDTILVVVGHLAGIAIIVGYEHAHVVTSKALAFVQKPKT